MAKKKSRLNPGIMYTFISALIIIAGTIVAIQYAKGNFRVTRNGFVPESGLVAANSFPTGAEVYVDGRLVTATDDTIYLEPGTYEVKIVKDGYSPWSKTMQVEKELVTQTNALLFPLVPSLSPLTVNGVQRVLPSPDGQKLLLYTETANTTSKNGLYVFELGNNPLPLQKGPRQISGESSSISLNLAEYIWSPDSSEVMVSGDNREVLIESDRKNTIATQADISAQKRSILGKWEEEMYLRERQFMEEFPEEVVQIATQSARNVYLSPDKKRLLYTATEAVTIPDSIVPPLPATNTQPEVRQLEPNGIYVYDREEDKNFMIGMEAEELETNKQLLANDLFSRAPLTYEASPSAFTSLQATTSAQTATKFRRYHTSLEPGTYQWFPDSRHLIYTQEDQIHIVAYDGTNDTTVYSGPYANNFVYPWPDGSRLVILTSFSPNSPLNLYAIELK